MCAGADRGLAASTVLHSRMVCAAPPCCRCAAAAWSCAASCAARGRTNVNHTVTNVRGTVRLYPAERFVSDGNRRIHHRGPPRRAAAQARPGEGRITENQMGRFSRPSAFLAFRFAPGVLLRKRAEAAILDDRGGFKTHATRYLSRHSLEQKWSIWPLTLRVRLPAAET